MMVTTKSGSTYFFIQKEDGLYFMRGLLEGKLINDPSPKVGEPMRLDYFSINFYGKLGNDQSFIETTPVVSIK